jgi:hypothetical protein
MRKYHANDESAIRTERLVREWTRSGLVSRSQEESMLPDLKVDLRRTNVFLRFILVAFGLLIIWAAVALVGVLGGLRNEEPIAALCIVAAGGSFFLSEGLIKNLRLYRFGIEEAAALGFVSLLTVAVLAMLSNSYSYAWREFPFFAALIAGAVAAFAVYLRFGYIYAAIISMFCISVAPYATEWSHATQRLVAAGLLAVVFVGARRKSGENQNEFPGDEYRTIQAAAWLGIYVSLNVQLASIRSIFFTSEVSGSIYWVTFVLIWILPPIGIFLGVRDRDRALLDVNIVLALVTLATNKPYLHLQRQTWDPILFGLLLIGVAVGLRRWLAKGDQNGFTSARILLSDKRGLAVVATASAALHSIPQPAAPAQPDRGFHGEGGRSGGAGATGSF